MSSVSALNSGLQGIHKGLNGLKKNAHDIANANKREASSSAQQSAGPEDVTQPLVEMKLNKLQVQASAKVVQTGSDMLGTLIDMRA